MPTFRSNSSASTTMTVTLTEVGRANNQVTYRCNWSVTTGSATALGASSSNWRNLRIHRASDGVQLCDVQIKSSSTGWTYSSTYSGSFNFTFSLGTNNSGTLAVYIQTNDTGTQSCIWTNRAYCTNFNISYSLYYTSIGAPTGPALSPAAFLNTLNFSWGAAANGINNTVQSYHVYYRFNGGTEMGVDVGKVTSWVLDTTSLPPGTDVDFRVASIPQYGSAQWSSRSATIKKNRLPNIPTSPTVPKTSYIPGETIRVSFSNNGDPDGNLSGFEVATDQNETVVGTNASSSAVFVDVSTTGWQQGIQRRFRVRAYDARGVRSTWSTYTATVTLNTTPSESAVNFPVAGTTVYNQRPRVLLTAGATNDGPNHILCVNDGSEKTTALNGSLFSTGTNDNLASGRKAVYQPSSNLGTGSKTVSTRMYDSFLYSGSVSRSFTIAALSVTDPDLTVSGMKIKAVHITDLRTAVNNLRAAYGLAAATWTQLVAGTTSIGNLTIITELQTALQAVINVINGWDTANSTFDISVTWVNPAASGGGVDRVKLRQAIEQIRSTIAAI